MGDENKKTPLAHNKKSSSSPRSRSITPGHNAFSSTRTRKEPFSAPSSIQGRPFLTSPFLGAKGRLHQEKVAGPYPVDVGQQAFHADPASLWQKIAEQKKYLDEQIATPPAIEKNNGAGDSELHQDDPQKKTDSPRRRPETPVDELDLLTSPNLNATPTHRMGLEKDREERLLKLIRSGGSTSPKTKIANIYDPTSASMNKPDLNKPVPPEPGSPKRRFLEKLGLAIGSTPTLKPAMTAKAASSDPPKQSDNPMRIAIPPITTKLSATHSPKDQPQQAKNSEMQEPMVINALKVPQTPDWPLAGHKTIPSAQFFNGGLGVTPQPSEGSQSPPKSGQTAASSLQSQRVPFNSPSEALTVDPGAAHYYQKVSPAISAGHSVQGVFEPATSHVTGMSPRDHLANIGSASAPPHLSRGAECFSSPSIAATNYNLYSPSIYHSHGSWYPQAGHPYAPAALQPHPQIFHQQLTNPHARPCGYSQESPATLPRYESTPGVGTNGIYAPYGYPNGGGIPSAFGAAAVSGVEEMNRELSSQMQIIGEAISDLKASNEASFQILASSMRETNSHVLEELGKIQFNQRQTASLMSRLVEYMEALIAQTASPYRRFAFHPTSGQFNEGNSPSEPSSGRVRTSGSSSGQPHPAETLPSTTYTPKLAHRRRGTVDKDGIERGPNEQAYFKELGMPSHISLQDKNVHPAYRSSRNTQ